MIMYKAVASSIEEHNITKETDKYVFYDVPKVIAEGSYEIRESKKTSYHHWFASRSAAKDYLIQKATGIINEIEEDLKYRKEQLECIKSL